MYIMSFFTDGGSPKTGLTPKISIWRLSDNLLLVDNASMSEVGGGIYKYNYTAYSAQIDYGIRCDGGDILANSERYSFAGNEGFHDDIDSIKETVETIDVLTRRVLGMSQENYRLFNTTYDVTGTKLTGCTIKLYNNKGDCDADTNHFARYTMTAEYAMNGQLSNYKVVKEAS